MKLVYLDQNHEIVHEVANATCVPSHGDLIWFDEIFYIETIVHYPATNMVRVYLTDEPVANKKPVAEANKTNVNLDELSKLRGQVEKAQKDASGAKRDLLALRQYLKGKQRNDEAG